MLDTTRGRSAERATQVGNRDTARSNVFISTMRPSDRAAATVSMRQAGRDALLAERQGARDGRRVVSVGGGPRGEGGVRPLAITRESAGGRASSSWRGSGRSSSGFYRDRGFIDHVPGIGERGWLSPGFHTASRDRHHSHSRVGVHVGFGFYRSRSYCPTYYAPYFTPMTTAFISSPTIIQPTVIAESPVYLPPTAYAPAYESGYAPAYESGYAPAYEPGYAPVGTTYDTGEVGRLDTVPAPMPSGEAPAGTVLPSPNEAGSTPSGGEQMYLMMMEGTKAFSDGQYDAAARLFMEVALDDPNNADAALAYAVARFATGDYPIAAIAIRRGVRAYPDVVNSGFDIRDRYSRQEDFQGHVEALLAFLANRPADVDGLVTLGFVQHFSGQREAAAQSFEQVKRMSASDGSLAETFLHAAPAPESQEEATSSTGPAPTTPSLDPRTMPQSGYDTLLVPDE